jgi:Tol biopolymer transport system component
MRHLAFVRYSSVGASASDLYLLDLSADLGPQGQAQRLTSYNREVSSPVWTPDGRTILLARHEAGGAHSLWRMNLADNREVEPLPIATDTSYSLTLLRSGDRIVYTRDSSTVNVWAVDLNVAQNGSPDRIRPWVTSTAREDNPQFSPDGRDRHIAYQSLRSGRNEI